MRRYRLTLAYDGTGMVGWQRQASGTSVQGLLEDSLGVLDGRHVTVEGAGRTDAGVHALGQVVSFALERDIDGPTLVRALNFHLPPAVRVITAAEVGDAFHARFDSHCKCYRYQIWNGDVVPPALRLYAWAVAAPLDVGAMSAAARLLEGRHDFAAFQSVGTELTTTERLLSASDVRVVDGGTAAPPDAAAGRLVVYEVCGSGFLRHMVRAIVGSLVDVGQGRREPTWMTAVLESRDRDKAGRTAPPEGLFLVSVSY